MALEWHSLVPRNAPGQRGCGHSTTDSIQQNPAKANRGAIFFYRLRQRIRGTILLVWAIGGPPARPRRIPNPGRCPGARRGLAANPAGASSGPWRIPVSGRCLGARRRLAANPAGASSGPWRIPVSGPKSRLFAEQVSPGFWFFAPPLLIVYLSTAPKVIHSEVWPYISSKFRHFRVKNRSNGVKIVSKKVKKGAHFVMPILTFWLFTPLGASARAVFAFRKGKKGAFSGRSGASSKVIHKLAAVVDRAGPFGSPRRPSQPESGIDARPAHGL